MNKAEKNKLNMLFFLGMVLGAVSFVFIYGLRPLNVTYDSFMFRSDVDMRQHYLGWMAYRNARWTFPLGRIDSLSYPTPMSIVFTDSIPLAALFFKLIRGILPVTFQYFGFFALVSYCLQGGFAARLIYRVSKNLLMAFAGSLTFIFSYTMLSRTFYHTSLSAQWIVLLALELWFMGAAGWEVKRQCVICTLTGVLCAGIHIYFLPITLAVLAASYLELIIKQGVIKKNLIQFIIAALCQIITAAFVLWVLGGFSVKAEGGEYWLGDFGANLLTFINPMGWSAFLPSFELYTPTQSEGGAYLGLGILSTGLIFGVLLVLKNLKNNTLFNIANKITASSRIAAGLIFAAVMFVVSVFPLISAGSYRLLLIPYPDFLKNLFGIFRSNGRFIWPVYYLIMLSVFALAGKVFAGIHENGKAGFKKALVFLVVISCVILQLADMSPLINKKRKGYFYAKTWHYVTEFDRFGFDTEKYKHIVSFDGDGSILMAAGYYAQRKHITLNRFYFARDIEITTKEWLDRYKEEIIKGSAREDYIYVFDRDTYEEVKEAPLYFYKGEKCVIGLRDAASGHELLKTGDLDEIEWTQGF